jgi:hypothetical protein
VRGDGAQAALGSRTNDQQDTKPINQETDMSDFVVRLDTTKLTDQQAAAVAGAIQGAVMATLGKLDLAHGKAPAVGGGSIFFHPEWRGLWLMDLKNLQQLKQIPTLTIEARGGLG